MILIWILIQTKVLKNGEIYKLIENLNTKWILTIKIFRYDNGIMVILKQVFRDESDIYEWNDMKSGTCLKVI